MPSPVQVFGRRHHERRLLLRRPASKKRQGTKSRGGLGGGRQPALWRLIGAPVMVGGAELASGDQGKVWKGAWKRAMGIRWWRGAYQRAIGSLIGVVAPREIAAGVEPAQRNGTAAALGRGLAHVVSNVLGVGRHLGSQPRAKTSMTIMRAPQRGHEQRSARGGRSRRLTCLR